MIQHSEPSVAVEIVCECGLVLDYKVGVVVSELEASLVDVKLGNWNRCDESSVFVIHWNSV